MRRLIVTVALAAVLTGGARAADIVVESRAEGQNFANYEELTSNWVDSNTPAATAKSNAPGMTTPTQAGSRKAAFSAANVTPKNPNPAIARFYPRVSEPGHYFVYVTWPRAANATPVEYTIRHAGGATVKSVSQNGWGIGGPINSDVWMPLGDYDFAPGNDQYVEVRIGANVMPIDARNIGQIYADGVRFTTKELTEGVASREQEMLVSPLANASAVAAATGTAPGQGAAPAGGPSLGSALAAPGTSPAGTLNWLSDVGAGQEQARAAGKKIVVFFTAPESSTSTYYQDTVFKDSGVAGLLSANYVLVKIDFTANTNLAYKLQIFRAGTINVYSSSGQPLAQFTERLTPAEFLQRLQGL